MTTTTTTHPETTAELWTYTGIRANSGKSWTTWLDPAGRTVSYSQPKLQKRDGVIGVAYEATVSRRPREDGDGETVILYGMPAYVGGEVPDPRAAEWDALHRAAKVRLAAIRQERKLTADSPLDRALRPLLEIAGKMRTNADRDALTAIVINEMRRSWATRGAR